MTDIVPFAALALVSGQDGSGRSGQVLAEKGVELVSTGGTAKALRDAGLDVKDISELTGFPEMMDGRVKTLHPKVHGGLLAVRDNAEHVASMNEHEIGAIDLVVVNLYPFVQTVAKGARAKRSSRTSTSAAPMVRSAAKNHDFVAIVTDPADYAIVAAGETTLAQRRKLPPRPMR
jgi:phosphoribosylaminoimidazolecarboxamide formyltransferase/IMP cyclohydrolase